MNPAILERYRCPEQFIRSRISEQLSGVNKFFRFGADILCFGQFVVSNGFASHNGFIHDVIQEVQLENGRLLLPFNPTEIIDNLRHESYAGRFHGLRDAPISKALYYLVRPMLPPPLRRSLQRIYFRGWEDIAFPQWPLDVTVENLLEKLLLLYMRAAGIESIPFIWFWPNGAESAAIMTHDVETAAGRKLCSRLMSIDESFGISSSFQIVPEKRYAVSPEFLNEIRDRGHEVNIQDLNHDGRLFRDRAGFEARVKMINAYGREFHARGFRSAVLYRNLHWFDLLEFDFDMSVPNVGHLDAQRGGCCTVFPYFIGRLLEIPVTTSQDYTVFHMLRQHDLELWKSQITGVTQRHGLVSMIVHPDYVMEKQAQSTYRELLGYLNDCRAASGMWITTPNEVNDWWRLRSAMKLVHRDGVWEIQGAGKERARIAYARSSGERIAYSLS